MPVPYTDDDSDDDPFEFSDAKLVVGETESEVVVSDFIARFGRPPTDSAEDEWDDMEIDSTGPEPTHSCIQCGDDRYIESAPGSDYAWCGTCETVRKHRRLDSEFVD